jgi:hypothetical protein
MLVYISCGLGNIEYFTQTTCSVLYANIYLYVSLPILAEEKIFLHFPMIFLPLIHLGILCILRQRIRNIFPSDIMFHFLKYSTDFD